MAKPILGGLPEQLMREIIQRVCQALPDKVEKIVLYGSYARGDADSDSDVDVIAFVKGGKENEKSIRATLVDIAFELSLQYGLDISIMLQDLHEYEEWLPYVPFFQNVVREGVIIYDEQPTGDTIPIQTGESQIGDRISQGLS